MKVVVIGPLPPPRGGVAVHISRMAGVLEAHGIEYEIHNESKSACTDQHVHPIARYRRFMFKIPFLKGDLLHFHTIDKRLRMALGLYKLLGQKIILTVHGENLKHQFQKSSRIGRWLLLKSLKSIDAVICVNEATTRQLRLMGLRREQVITLPAYIHPQEREEEMRAIPQEVYRFMEEADFTICANGYVRFHQNEDLYGIDLLIQLMKELRSCNANVRLVFAVMGVTGQTAAEKRHYEQLQWRILAYGLKSHFYFYEVDNTEFYPIARKSHLFIRPTNTDGFGMSIAEALHYGVPSVASDVCARPEGTVVFKSRDLEDLIVKVRHIIDHYGSYKEQAANVKVTDYAAELTDIYFRIAGKEKTSYSTFTGTYGK